MPGPAPEILPFPSGGAMFPSRSLPHSQTCGDSPLFAADPRLLPADPRPRKATVRDADGMSVLINEFASARIMLARGPLYLYQSIQDYRVITMPAQPDESGGESAAERVVACGGLHVLWEDLAEVRSVAVHPSLQRRGLGKAMVRTLLEDARRLCVRRVFTFTLAEGFFRSLGFSAVSREDMPPVVWAECSKCPKFYKCDEIGMMCHLSPERA
jgi:amino-acid N-acetyltransferase